MPKLWREQFDGGYDIASKIDGMNPPNDLVRESIEYLEYLGVPIPKDNARIVAQYVDRLESQTRHKNEMAMREITELITSQNLSGLKAVLEQIGYTNLTKEKILPTAIDYTKEWVRDQIRSQMEPKDNLRYMDGI